MKLYANNFPSGNVYAQRELWDKSKDVIAGMLAYLGLVSYKYYDYHTKLSLWITKSYWKKLCQDRDKTPQ